MEAKRILIERGRGYLYKGRYPQLTVFTPRVEEATCLKQAFGGNYYRHGNGVVWVLSRRDALDAVLSAIAPEQSVSGFENIIRRHSDEKV